MLHKTCFSLRSKLNLKSHRFKFQFGKVSFINPLIYAVNLLLFALLANAHWLEPIWTLKKTGCFDLLVSVITQP
ncbi:hypothetical protein QQP08_027449 [Theobroma cacao]|nr:hypothetical protein QQP08_027449 [Theobroma cacao]